MKIRSNVHTHSTWCDGADTPVQVLEAAMKLGFTDLGFSSHSPTPFDPTCPGVADEARYIAEIAALKKTYEGKIAVLCGIEQDTYAPVDKSRYDYVIGSHHYIEFLDGERLAVDSNPETFKHMRDRRFGGDAVAMAKRYYAGLVESARRYEPTVVAHFDLMAKFNRGSSLFDECGVAYRRVALEAMDALMDVVEKYGGLIEVNTGAMAKGLREVPYPAPFLLRHMADRKARVIISSDCHRKDRLDAFFDAAQDFLRDAGFKQMVVLQDGVFADAAL